VKAVRGHEVPLKKNEREIVKLLKQVMPRQDRKSHPIRKLYDSWIQLRSDLAPEELKMLREGTRQGKAFGPLLMIQNLEKSLKIKLLPSPRGRPKQE